MTPIVNLHILAEKFSQLSNSAFFDPAFANFATRTVEAIKHVIDEQNYYADPIVRNFEHHVWGVLQFVSGSRSNDAPYETQFVLRKAIQEWIQEDVLISSSALESFDFHLNTADLWEHIGQTLNKFDTQNYKPSVVRIGSPEAFKHRPVFCIPLFHELGHFVDLHYRVSETSLILAPPAPPPKPMDPKDWQRINLRHRAEHFADLFAASYCGEASILTLETIAPNNRVSVSHPATKERAKVVRNFLAKIQNDKVDILQNALNKRTGKTLKIRYEVPDPRGSFDDVLTYRIQNIEELYGIFIAGWDYLHNQLQNKTAPWIDGDVSDGAIEKTVNDLVEKSIRNFELVEKWNNAAPNQN